MHVLGACGAQLKALSGCLFFPLMLGPVSCQAQLLVLGPKSGLPSPQGRGGLLGLSVYTAVALSLSVGLGGSEPYKHVLSFVPQGAPDVRQAYIQFALSFLVTGDSSTVVQVLELKGASTGRVVCGRNCRVFPYWSSAASVAAVCACVSLGL